MKKTMIYVWMVFALSATVVSCGDDKKSDDKDKDKKTEKPAEKEEAVEDGLLKLKMSGIEGTIELPKETQFISGSDNRQDGQLITYLGLKVGENTLNIHPAMPSLEELKAELMKYNKEENPEVVILDEGDDFFFYSQRVKNYDGKGGEPEERTGYAWYYVLKQGAKTYTISVESEFFKPVWDEKEARKLLNAARTFKPAN